MARFLDVEWDGAEVGRLLQKKALRYNKDISGMIRGELGKAADTAARALPPFESAQVAKPSYTRGKQIGEFAVTKGYAYTYPTLLGQDYTSGNSRFRGPSAFKAIERIAGREVASHAYVLANRVSEKRALDYLREKGVPVDFPTKGAHDAIRTKRANGHPGKTDFVAVSPKRGRISRLRGSKDRVGRLKASYSVAAVEISPKQRVPKWVSRHHGRREGKADLSKLYRPWAQEASAIPYAQYAPEGARKHVDRALAVRQNNLRKEIAFVERKAARYFNRR